MAQSGDDGDVADHLSGAPNASHVLDDPLSVAALNKILRSPPKSVGWVALRVWWFVHYVASAAKAEEE
jgi:hypothetical protein